MFGEGVQISGKGRETDFFYIYKSTNAVDISMIKIESLRESHQTVAFPLNAVDDLQ